MLTAHQLIDLFLRTYPAANTRMLSYCEHKDALAAFVPVEHSSGLWEIKLCCRACAIAELQAS